VKPTLPSSLRAAQVDDDVQLRREFRQVDRGAIAERADGLIGRRVVEGEARDRDGERAVGGRVDLERVVVLAGVDVIAAGVADEQVVARPAAQRVIAVPPITVSLPEPVTTLSAPHLPLT
jgi:hypothetical protein